MLRYTNYIALHYNYNYKCSSNYNHNYNYNYRYITLHYTTVITLH
jgi:hypothetical protein